MAFSRAHQHWLATADRAQVVAVARFVHRVDHLQWRQGKGPLSSEGDYVGECWLGVPPQWALDRAEAGEPGSRWCPLITPELAET